MRGDSLADVLGKLVILRQLFSIGYASVEELLVLIHLGEVATDLIDHVTHIEDACVIIYITYDLNY